MGNKRRTIINLETVPIDPEETSPQLDLVDGVEVGRAIGRFATARTLAYRDDALGEWASHGWVARIKGFDSKHRFARDFLRRHDATFREPGQRINLYRIMIPGYYEAQSWGGEPFRLFFHVDMDLHLTLVEEDEVVAGLDDDLGQGFGEVRSLVARCAWGAAWDAARLIGHPDERAAACAYVTRALRHHDRALPTLTGSPKQTDWAYRLRRQALDAIAALTEKMRGFERAGVEGDFSKVFARHEQAARAAAELTDSAFWIEHRDVWSQARVAIELLLKPRPQLDEALEVEESAQALRR